MTTMMGVPAIYLFMAQQPGFADRRPLDPRRAVVGGAPMPEALLETWARARRRDRPGLRPDRGGAERPLPAARGRGTQGGLRGQAVPVRRREALGGGRAAGPRPERLPRATGGTRRRRRRVHATAGCAPATSPSATTRASTGSRAASRNVHLRRRERLSGRGRGGAARASGGGRRCGRRRPDERWGEVGVAFVVLRRRRRGRAARVLPRAARPVQGAEVVPVRRRAAAQRRSARCRRQRATQRRWCA